MLSQNPVNEVNHQTLRDELDEFFAGFSNFIGLLKNFEGFETSDMSVMMNPNNQEFLNSLFVHRGKVVALVENTLEYRAYLEDDIAMEDVFQMFRLLAEASRKN